MIMATKTTHLFSHRVFYDIRQINTRRIVCRRTVVDRRREKKTKGDEMQSGQNTKRRCDESLNPFGKRRKRSTVHAASR